MTMYNLTVSTEALDLGILSNVRITVKRKRTVVSDVFPSTNLSSQETVTNASGIATILLAADDGTVFHEVRIHNSRDMVIYFKAFTMPPQDVALDLLPVEDLISTSASIAVQAKDAAQTSATNAANSETNAANSANSAAVSETNASNSASAASTSATNAINSANAASSSANLAEAARDAAIIGSGVYATEAAGRAAVADGVAFKVQGSGDIAAYEYRRTNSTTSVLIATYPASSAVDKKVIGELGKNIFNKNAADVAIGYFPISTTGNLQANAAYNTTGFIPVTASTAYVVSTKHYWCWYDASKVFISGTNDSVASKTQTSPANAAYMRCSFAVANWNNAQVELGTTPSSYEAFRYFLPASAIKNNTIVTGALADKAVTPEKTNFLAIGKNLFNKATIIEDFYLTNEGVAVALPNHRYSDFIPVTADVQYYGSATGYTTAIRMYCFYDANLDVIAGGSNATSSTFTAPAGAAYVRVTLENTYEDSFQLEVGATATAYEAYAYRLSLASGVPIIATQDTSTIETITTGALADKAVTPAKTNFLAIGKNLFNKATITADYYLSNAGVATALANHRYSDFIPVLPNTQYYGSATGYTTAIRMYCFYDENFAVVSGGSNVTSSTFTTPSNAAYVRLTLENTYEDTFMLEAGASATAYEAYAYKLELPSGIPIFATQDTGKISSLWEGKTWATLGDSITNANVYQVKVASMLGLTYTNFGVSGSTLCGLVDSTTAMCQDTRINAIATTFDLVTVLAGTNDWAQSFQLGATNSTDPLTFNGALNTLLSKLSTRFATKRIVMMTTTYGEYSGGVGVGWPNSTVNTVGLTSLDYADAVRAACKRWCVPCIDLSACGWNSANIATYVADGLHPNTTGYRRMSEVIIGGLKAITPLV